LHPLKAAEAMKKEAMLEIKEEKLKTQKTKNNLMRDSKKILPHKKEQKIE
jgi:hypothetical protein